MQRARPITSFPYLSRAITELARFNDSIKTDHCRIITILVASSTAANSVPTPKPRNERLSHPISSWLVTVTTASTALLSPRRWHVVLPYVPGKEGWCRSPRPQAPLGPLNDYHI
ncbi:hypothetical protein ACKLNR_001062 [Fusarium oxysporum f. sp. zingiberi]